MRTATRDTQYSEHAELVHDTVKKLSSATRRLSLIESHMLAKPPPAVQPNSPKPPTPCDKKSPAYWREATGTLSYENATLTNRLTQSEEECVRLKHMMQRSAAQRKESENALIEAQRELALISTTHRYTCAQISTRATYTTVSASTQGRDAVYWHQTCRSIEEELLKRITELEIRVEELTEAESTKRRKTDSAIEMK
jgi:hypothetical protein